MKAAELFDIAGKVAVITGGAAGIGRAYAQAMADNGAQVVLLDRDGARLAATIAELSATGAPVSGAIVDVSDRTLLREAIDAAAVRHNRLDIVFANAGIAIMPGFLSMQGEREPGGALENIPDAEWDRMLAINITSVLATMQAAIPHMKKAGQGRIIVTSSVAALRARPMVGSAYPVTKAAVAHLVKQAALELARYRITVNAILPGPFATALMTPPLADYARRSNPMHRAASTDEIQGLALFLASPASSFVTGSHMVIDGGQSLGEAD